MSSRLLARAFRAPTIGLVGPGLVGLFGRAALAQDVPAAAVNETGPAPVQPGAAPPAAEVAPLAQPPATASGTASPAAQIPAPGGETLSPGATPAVPAPAPATDGLAPAAQGLAPGTDGLVPAAQGLAPAADSLAPAEALAHAADHSLLGLVVQAGPVVQGVMGALVIASVVCWAIMFEKAVLLGRLQREIRLLGKTGDPAAATGEGLAARMQRAAAREWAEGRDHDESRGEYRERIERAMRETLTGTIRRAQSGTAFLATTGAIGPFVGLFGTVWGIMGSFQGIAASRDTSLAVVAPGIAEALLATAIGLFAAIPAVIGYNRIARRIAGLRAEALSAISATGARLSGRPPRGGLVRAAE